MKFSYRQVLASAGGAVLSAVIASIFGVKGTIVGVAIGSIVATMGTALVFQSIERTNQAVKQVVVRTPDNARILRRLGGTKVTGGASSESSHASELHEHTATSAAVTDASLGEPESSTDIDDRRDSPPPAPAPSPSPRTNLRWLQIAGVAIGVFVFALVLVTVVEIIAGRPLADLFGHSGGGTTVDRIFESPTTTLPPPTTSTTTSTSSTTTTSPSSPTTTVGTTTSTDSGSTTTSSPTGASGASTPTTPTTG